VLGVGMCADSSEVMERAIRDGVDLICLRKDTSSGSEKLRWVNC